MTNNKNPFSIFLSLRLPNFFMLPNLSLFNKIHPRKMAAEVGGGGAQNNIPLYQNIICINILIG